MTATESVASCDATRPTNSRIVLVGVPAASIRTGSLIVRTVMSSPRSSRSGARVAAAHRHATPAVGVERDAAYVGTPRFGDRDRFGPLPGLGGARCRAVGPVPTDHSGAGVAL